MSEQPPNSWREIWMGRLAEDFGVLPDNPLFSEELDEEAALIGEHISFAVRSGADLETIKSLNGYHRFERVLQVIKAHKQADRIHRKKELEAIMEADYKMEAEALKAAQELVIPNDIIQYVREHRDIMDNEFDSFERYQKAFDELREKEEKDLRYRIASLELSGDTVRALHARVQYVKSLEEKH